MYYKFHVFVFPLDLGKQLGLTSLTSQQWSARDSWPAQLIVPTTTLPAYHTISAVGGLLLQHFLFNLAIDNGEHERYYKQIKMILGFKTQLLLPMGTR